MGDVEVVIRVKVPEEVGKYLDGRLMEDIKLGILREYQERAEKARRLLKIFEKSQLTEEDAKKLEEELKTALAKRHGVL